MPCRSLDQSCDFLRIVFPADLVSVGPYKDISIFVEKKYKVDVSPVSSNGSTISSSDHQSHTLCDPLCLHDC
jgi:hypothetical protein